LKLSGFIRTHRVFTCFFTALYAALLYPLLSFRQGFVLGDYELQFLPWTHAYAWALKAGVLLLWTPLMQSGFPLFAEGQTGMLYPLNLILFKFFSFRTGYTLMFLLHFLMGGVFTYLFARRLRLSGYAATLAALIFTFGSSYAGLSYNIGAMRTLVWFPLCLLAVESFITRPRALPLLALSFLLGVSWLGGGGQMAAYACGFVLLYYFLRSREKKTRARGQDIGFLLSVAASLLIGLPQLWSTFELAFHSTRTLQSKGFALWGSFAPWSLGTLFNYTWSGFLRAQVYLGVIPLFLFCVVPRQRNFRVFWVLALFGFLLALGAFNPLYWVLVQLPFAALLRNPAKFLFFTSFFLAIWAGLAFDRLSQASPEEVRRVFSRVAVLGTVFFGAAAALWLVAHRAAGVLVSFGEWYVHAFVLGKGHHRYSLEFYEQKVQSILSVLRTEVNLSQPFFWMPFLFVLLFLVSLYALGRGRLRAPAFQKLILMFLVLDLFIYGKSGYGTGFLGNVAPFPDHAAALRIPRDGRWIDAAEQPQAFFPPNRNMITGHASAGAYAPLLDRDYFLLTDGFGMLDDSLGRREVSRDVYEEAASLIGFMGVKYFVGGTAAAIGPFRPPASLLSSGGFLLTRAHPREEFSLVGSVKHFEKAEEARAYLRSPDFRPEFEVVTLDRTLSVPGGEMSGASLVVKEEGPLRTLLEVRSGGAVLVRNQVYDRGWKVTVSGEPRMLRRVNGAFQGLTIPSGFHEVEFNFRPQSYIIGRWFYVAGLLITGCGFLLLSLLKRKESLTGEAGENLKT